MSRTDELEALAAKARAGGAPKYHQANAAAGKLFCRERIALLCDDGGKRCLLAHVERGITKLIDDADQPRRAEIS